jgi:hypothetical protein
MLCEETAELFSGLKNFLTGYSQAQFDVFLPSGTPPSRLANPLLAGFADEKASVPPRSKFPQ